MNLTWIFAAAFSMLTLFLSACGGNSFQGNDFSSRGPASSEPAYYGKPTDVTNGLRVQMKAKFLYRALRFVPGDNPNNGLGAVVDAVDAIPIPFAEFHIYDSTGARIQQGETSTDGTVDFYIPKQAGTYTLKVFSRALNDYLKVSVLEDIYNNTPYSVAKTFTVTASDITSGSLDLRNSPLLAEADESKSSKIEGGAFNIYFDILIANEYIRRNIGKNNGGVPSADSNKWWVADKVTVYWKAGFNPYSYFEKDGGALSFYSPGERKLYILGGVNGDVKKADTDHFDDSVILHEYGHFLEDAYGHSESPGGSHNGNFVIDPRLAWSEGWANYFQAAVLTGAEAHDDGDPNENRMPSNKKFNYYVDTYGYKSAGGGMGISFSLVELGASAAFDAVADHPQDTGIFREVSIARTLYKSSRGTGYTYPDTSSTRKGGGISFANIWKTFSGEDTNGYSRYNPLTNSFSNKSTFPIPHGGLFNLLLSRNAGPGTDWNSIISEERQTVGSKDYAYFLEKTSGCSTTTLTNPAAEKAMPLSSLKKSDQQLNNDFYLVYYSGGTDKIQLDYSTTGNAIDLDLILYYGSYVYFEDQYWFADYTSPYVVRYSRTAYSSSEEINLSGLPAGYYMLNVKVNMHGSTSAIAGTATYTLKRNGSVVCGKDR